MFISTRAMILVLVVVGVVALLAFVPPAMPERRVYSRAAAVLVGVLILLLLWFAGLLR